MFEQISEFLYGKGREDLVETDRALEKRARLEFWFPRPGGGNYMFFIPFFENPVIKEQKKARYAKYNVMSRSSQLYAYTGADSRKLKVSFTLTQPHLMNFDMGINRYKRLMLNNAPEQERDSFFKNPIAKSGTLSKNSDGETEYSHAQTYDGDYLRKAFNLIDQESAAGFDQLLQQIEDISFKEKASLGPEYIKMLDTLLYFIVLIRASVVNNSINPLYGPPVVRLKYGMMYQDIPCICTSYSVDADDKAGYDLPTLMPRRVRISLSLEEVRAGSFGPFQPMSSPGATLTRRDNLVGWECLVTPELNSTFDPGEVF